MKTISVIGEIGSGKTYVANNFGYVVFNADKEINKIYKNNRKCFKLLKKKFPYNISKFPISKKELAKLILIKKKSDKWFKKLRINATILASISFFI